MNLLLAFEIIYLVLILAVCLRIVYETRMSVKALAYVMVVIFLPFIGMFFYFSSWSKRSAMRKLVENSARLVSPLL